MGVVALVDVSFGADYRPSGQSAWGALFTLLADRAWEATSVAAIGLPVDLPDTCLRAAPALLLISPN